MRVAGTHGDQVAASVAGFAAQLRELREQAGRPSYRQLAQLAHYSHTALSQAAAGGSLPSLAVTQAFVRACGGDEAEWSARWREVDQVVRSADDPPRPPAPGAGPSGAGRARPDSGDSGWRAAVGWLRARAAIVTAAGLVAVASVATVVLLWPAGSTVQARAHMQLEHSGLYVRYGAQLCGSIDLGPATCARVTARSQPNA
jgi:hypothetical protein